MAVARCPECAASILIDHPITVSFTCGTKVNLQDGKIVNTLQSASCRDFVIIKLRKRLRSWAEQIVDVSDTPDVVSDLIISASDHEDDLDQDAAQINEWSDRCLLLESEARNYLGGYNGT